VKIYTLSLLLFVLFALDHNVISCWAQFSLCTPFLESVCTCGRPLRWL